MTCIHYSNIVGSVPWSLEPFNPGMSADHHIKQLALKKWLTPKGISLPHLFNGKGVTFEKIWIDLKTAPELYQK